MKDIDSVYWDAENKIVDNVAFHIVYPDLNTPFNLEIKRIDSEVGNDSGLELKDPVTLTLDQEKGNLWLTSRTFEMFSNNISKQEHFRIFVGMASVLGKS